MFDADDLVIEPRLARVDIIDGIRTQNLSEGEVEAYYQRTLESFEAADWACCSTEEIASAMRLRGKPTFVLPNGFTDAGHQRARLALRNRRADSADGLIRIGYAAGTRTHQRDFGQAAKAIASVLRKNSHCRLVLFRRPGSEESLVDPFECGFFHDVTDQIEWRDLVAQDDLSLEIARFDVNVAPLQTANRFCEAKSEVKFIEAALVEVCTVASPTGPFRRAIRHEQTGFLVDSTAEWESTLQRLVNEPSLRRRVGHEAYRNVLWKYGAHRRAETAAAILDQTLGTSRAAATAGVVQMLCRPDTETSQVVLPHFRTVFDSDRCGNADVTVAIPLYNYAQYVIEALESVAAQTLREIDLVVVDDGSTDHSLSAAERWIRAHSTRFNRVLLLANLDNAGLGPTRNAAIDGAETTFVLPLDADNRLLPKACETLLATIRTDQAAFVYPFLKQFGDGDAIMGKIQYSPAMLVGGNSIDAMAIIRKDCWSAVGGYARMEPQGWEDFDFWCRLAEKGMWGRQHPEILAEYRVHRTSMQKRSTDVADQKQKLLILMQKRHPWLSHVESFEPMPDSKGLRTPGSQSCAEPSAGV